VVMGTDSVTRFHRLFGDSDGDRDVDAADQAAFNSAYGQTDAASLATFDFDNNKRIGTLDQKAFNNHFGKTM
jgi:hypothetical protein